MSRRLTSEQAEGIVNLWKKNGYAFVGNVSINPSDYRFLVNQEFINVSVDKLLIQTHVLSSEISDLEEDIRRAEKSMTTGVLDKLDSEIETAYQHYLQNRDDLKTADRLAKFERFLYIHVRNIASIEDFRQELNFKRKCYASVDLTIKKIEFRDKSEQDGIKFNNLVEERIAFLQSLGYDVKVIPAYNPDGTSNIGAVSLYKKLK